MQTQSLRNLILILSIAFLGVSCNDDSSTGVDSGGAATFEGKVENTSAQKSTASSSSTVEGAVVTAAHVNTDGSLETISSNQVQTNAEGEYSLSVDVSAAAETSNRIIIVAESEGQSAKAFVASNVENGNTFTVQPISFESSAEADVFQNIVANGNTDLVAKADIEAAVESDVAADIEGSADNAASVASALVSSAEAKVQFYAEKGVEISEDQRQQVMQIKQEAQVQLDTELDAAANTQEEQAAFNTFMQTVADAELEAGVEAWAVAESNDFAARVLIQNNADLSTDAQSEIRKHAYFFTAVAVEAAVRAEADVLEASESTINAIADAGATLRTEIKSTSNASKGAIDDLFIRFNEDVQAAFNSDTSLNGNAFVTANTAISGSAALKSTLESTLSATVDLNTMLSAYTAFTSGVKTTVDTTFTEANETETQAYTRVLVLINIAS